MILKKLSETNYLLDGLNEEALIAFEELLSSECVQNSRNDYSQPLLKPGVNFLRFGSKSEKRSSKSESEANVGKKGRMDQLKRDLFRANYLGVKVRSEIQANKKSTRQVIYVDLSLKGKEESEEDKESEESEEKKEGEMSEEDKEGKES